MPPNTIAASTVTLPLVFTLFKPASFRDARLGLHVSPRWVLWNGYVQHDNREAALKLGLPRSLNARNHKGPSQSCQALHKSSSP